MASGCGGWCLRLQCSSTWDFLFARYGQWGHIKGFSPVCVLMCLVSTPEWRNNRPQKGHGREGTWWLLRAPSNAPSKPLRSCESTSTYKRDVPWERASSSSYQKENRKIFFSFFFLLLFYTRLLLTFFSLPNTARIAKIHNLSTSSLVY